MTHLTADHRRRIMINAAVELAEANGLYEFNLKSVAKLAECSHSLVVYYYGSLLNLRAALIQYCIDTKHDRLLAQAIAKRDPVVDGLSAARRREVMLKAAK